MEIFCALLTICAGNAPATGEFSSRRRVTRIFDVSFDLRLNKRLIKQSWCWWFETRWRPLWRHCNVSYPYPIHDNKTYMIKHKYFIWYQQGLQKKRYIDKGGNMRVYKENVSFTWFNSVDPSGSAMPIHVICNDVHTIFSTCHHVSLLIIVIIYHPLHCDMVTFCWNGKLVGVCVREVHYTWFHVK